MRAAWDKHHDMKFPREVHRPIPVIDVTIKFNQLWRIPPLSCSPQQPPTMLVKKEKALPTMQVCSHNPLGGCSPKK